MGGGAQIESGVYNSAKSFSFRWIHITNTTRIEKYISHTDVHMFMLSEKVEHINEVDRFILLLLGAKDSESVPGHLYLQKEIYLLQNLFPNLASETDYEPYLMGQYSEVVANELEELESSGLVKSASGLLVLTEDGSAVLEELKKTSSEGEIRKVEEFKHLLNDMTRDELLAFVYFSDPSQDKLEEESTEYNDLVQNRKQLAISMYKKDKISAQKAAEISGEDFEDFFAELKKVL